MSKTTCQELANEKRSLNSINYHNSNKHHQKIYHLAKTMNTKETSTLFASPDYI